MCPDPQAIEAELRKLEGEIEAVNEQIAACTDRGTLAYLRRKEEQLRRKEEQLREKELILLEKELILLRNAAATAGPSVAPSALNLDEAATRFFATLRSMAVPDAGDLLTVGNGDVFLLHSPNYQLYVRKCYPELFEALYESTSKKHVVTGTPGIGKSYFFYYMLLRLLHSTSPPPFILWEHFTFPGGVWCYMHETGQVWYSGSGRMPFLEVFRNPATWYFADAVPPNPSCAAHRVLLTSPVYVTMKEMVKEAAEVLYMPLWEHEELLDCHSKMYSAVPVATVEELYKCYGGVARYVLKHPFENPSWGLPKLLEPLISVLDVCNVEQVRQAIGAIDMGPEASHRLVHIVPYKNFTEKILSFASDWVADKFVERAWIFEQERLKTLLEYSASVVKGILFEKVMHGVLAMGGKFDVVPLHPETLERGEKEELDIQACTASLRFTDDEASDLTSSLKNMYLRPMSGNFPVIDALKVPEMHLFQMTVSENKVVDADDLEDVLKRLGIPALGQEGCQPSLYFVVHPDVYNTFKVRAAKKKLKSGQDGKERKAAWPPNPKEKYVRSAITRLYIMRGTYRRPLGPLARLGPLLRGRIVPVQV